jgi:hypothetical protein
MVTVVKSEWHQIERRFGFEFDEDIIAEIYPDLDEEESTLKILSLKEKELDKILFLGSPDLSKIITKRGHSMIRGPMDAFCRQLGNSGK